MSPSVVFILLWLALGYAGYLVVLYGDGENRLLDKKRLLTGFIASMGGGALLAAALFDQYRKGRLFRKREEALGD